MTCLVDWWNCSERSSVTLFTIFIINCVWISNQSASLTFAIAILFWMRSVHCSSLCLLLAWPISEHAAEMAIPNFIIDLNITVHLLPNHYLIALWSILQPCWISPLSFTVNYLINPSQVVPTCRPSPSPLITTTCFPHQQRQDREEEEEGCPSEGEEAAGAAVGVDDWPGQTHLWYLISDRLEGNIIVSGVIRCFSFKNFTQKKSKQQGGLEDVGPVKPESS